MKYFIRIWHVMAFIHYICASIILYYRADYRTSFLQTIDSPLFVVGMFGAPFIMWLFVYKYVDTKQKTYLYAIVQSVIFAIFSWYIALKFAGAGA